MFYGCRNLQSSDVRTAVEYIVANILCANRQFYIYHLLTIQVEATSRTCRISRSILEVDVSPIIQIIYVHLAQNWAMVECILIHSQLGFMCLECHTLQSRTVFKRTGANTFRLLWNRNISKITVIDERTCLHRLQRLR